MNRLSLLQVERLNLDQIPRCSMFVSITSRAIYRRPKTGRWSKRVCEPSSGSFIRQRTQNSDISHLSHPLRKRIINPTPIKTSITPRIINTSLNPSLRIIEILIRTNPRHLISHRTRITPRGILNLSTLLRRDSRHNVQL